MHPKYPSFNEEILYCLHVDTWSRVQTATIRQRIIHHIVGNFLRSVGKNWTTYPSPNGGSEPNLDKPCREDKLNTKRIS